MPLPIKLNEYTFKLNIPGVIPDPRIIANHISNSNKFERYINTFNINRTFKITKKDRQPITDELIKKLLEKEEAISILEVGSSCGINSLKLINDLDQKLKKFFITDLFFGMPYLNKSGFTYFYHPKSKKCVMAASDKFVYYDALKTRFPFLNRITSKVISSAPNLREKYEVLNFLHPKIRTLKKNDNRIEVFEYDIFNKWKLEKVNVVKCANVLNKAYFNNKELNIAVKNLGSILTEDGILAITRNRSFNNEEIGTIFKKDKNKKLILIKEINGGIDFKIN